MKDAAIAELNQHATDELRHANMVAERILQLGGTPLLNPKEWFWIYRYHISKRPMQSIEERVKKALQNS